jgi:hypothetical protein
MVLAAVIALLISAPAPPQEPLSLEEWEACAIGTSDKCMISREAENWRTCMESVSPAREPVAWEKCEVTAFPECYPQEAPEDAFYLLRLCSEKQVVATRQIAEIWIAALGPLVGPDGKDFLATLVPTTEARANEDIVGEPWRATAHRSGTWRALLGPLALIREGVLTDGKSFSEMRPYD